MDQINALGFQEFTSHFGNVVEHFAVLGGGLWSQRPFQSVEHLHQCLTATLDELPPSLKEGILRVHPDLAGRMAEKGMLTSESTAEQKHAGLDTMSAEEKTLLRELNQRYKQKFGFPFVICARKNKKAAILNGIQARLKNAVEQEVLTGIEEVKKIAYYRILAVMASFQPSRL